MFAESPENSYDIIFMDVQMPLMDGYEATGAIRALDRADARAVPIVALTANAFKEDVDKALESGMNAHIAKPVEMDRLLEVLFEFLTAGRGRP
jgi:CheY-like chemotaxis protein